MIMRPHAAGRIDVIRPLLRAIVALAFAGVLACGSSAPLEPDRGVSAIAFGGTLRLSNRSDSTVYYMIVDPAILPLLDYVPCTTKGAGCRWLEPHSRVSLTNAEILGQPTALDEVLVIYWWKEVVGGDAIALRERRLLVALK